MKTAILSAKDYVPGLLNIGEMYDLVGLLMPRSLFIEAGIYDEIFPIEAVRQSVARVREICRVFKADEAQIFGYDEFSGRHRIHGHGAYRFLQNALGHL